MGTEPTNPSTGDNPDPNGTGNDPKPNNLDAILAKNAELLGANKKLREKLDAAEAEKKAAEAKELAEKERFKELWEQEQKKVAELTNQYTGLKTQVTDSLKFATLQDHLGITIPKKYHALVDIDRIEVDDAGKPVMTSVKAYGDVFKTEYGELFKAPSTIPQDNPKGGGSSVPSYKDWLELTKSDPKKADELMPAVFEREEKQRHATS